MSDAFEPKSIIVTGGCGFIGSNFVHYVAERHPEVKVTVLDKLTYAGNPANIEGTGAELVVGDICDEALLDELVPAHNAIVHFAAESHNDNSIADPSPFVKTNGEGTFRLLEACRRYGKRMHHVSTDEVYGDLALDDPARFTEETPYKPSSPYSSTKASSDMLVRAYMDTYHFPANITNCSNNYGPYQFPEKLIPLMIHNALEGKKLPVYGDGKNVRDWLYVEDHCKAIDMVQEKGRLFETYNVGGHNEKQNIEIVKTIIDVLRDELPDDDPRKAHLTEDLITYVQDRKGHDRRYAIAPDKIRAEIGWEPDTMFRQGIRRTIRWYFAHPEWMEHVTSGDYQRYYEKMYKM